MLGSVCAALLPHLHTLLFLEHTLTNAAPSSGLWQRDRLLSTSRWWWNSDSSPWRIGPAQQSRQPGGGRQWVFGNNDPLSTWMEVDDGGGSYQDLRSGAQGFCVFGNNTDVEDSRKNEDEARSWGGTWKDKKRSRSCLKTTLQRKPQKKPKSMHHFLFRHTRK